MLLKISNGNGGFRVFDKVEEYDYNPRTRTLKKPEDINTIFPASQNIRSLVPLSAFQDSQSVEVGIIEFVKSSGFSLHVIFIGSAYICNDQGDTLDKITVGRHERNRK